MKTLLTIFVTSLIDIFLFHSVSLSDVTRYKTIKKQISCGSFTVFSQTVGVMSPDGFLRTTKQSLKMRDDASGQLHALDLWQHKSRNPLAGGILEIDAPAYSWRCVISPYSKPFLFVDFGCDNDYATSCPLSGREPGNEWEQVYDSTGRPLVKSTKGISATEQRKFQALGIENSFFPWEEIRPENYLK